MDHLLWPLGMEHLIFSGRAADVIGNISETSASSDLFQAGRDIAESYPTTGERDFYK